MKRPCTKCEEKESHAKLIFILLALIFGLAVYNFFTNRDFFKTSLSSIFTMIIAICITYIATKRDSNVRDIKRHAEYLLRNIQQLVLNENFYSIPISEDIEKSRKIREDIQMRNKKLRNLIDILKKYQDIFQIENELKYIDDNFSDYRKFVDESLMDLEELSKNRHALQNYATNIDSKCDTIISILYCQ